MTAVVPGLESCSSTVGSSPSSTVGASRDAGFGGRLVSQGGAVDSESAAIAMASLCRKAGLEFRPRSGDRSQFGCMVMVMLGEVVIQVTRQAFSRRRSAKIPQSI